MNKIVFSLILAVSSMGCSDTIVIVYPEMDAAMTSDGGVVIPLPLDSAPRADAAVDAVVAPDAVVTADAGMDAVVPPVCTGETDCCHAGQAIRVGAICGDYPDSADASCSAAGVCNPRIAQTCTDVNACCDGWSPIQIVFAAPCHCEVDYDADPPFVTGSPYHRACKNAPNDGAGNAAGYCGMEYAGSLFNGRPSQYTCISNTTWTP